MGYSKKAAQEVSDFKSKYMPAGINENVRIDKVEVKTSPNGNKMFDITFINDENQTAVHTEWEPKMAHWMTSAQDLERNQARQYKKMMQILLCYYTDEQINFEGESFTEFANWIATMLNVADKSKKLRLKLVYNKDGYTTIPTSVDDLFIEPMDVTESKIKINAKDIVVRPVIADKETKNDNPFTTPEVATTAFATNNDPNELPF